MITIEIEQTRSGIKAGDTVVTATGRRILVEAISQEYPSGDEYLVPATAEDCLQWIPAAGARKTDS